MAASPVLTLTRPAWSLRAALTILLYWLVFGGDRIAAKRFDYKDKLDCFENFSCGKTPLMPNETIRPPPSDEKSYETRSSSRASLEERAKPGEFPWFARLEIKWRTNESTDATETRYCGATLIHKHYLLTSASCFNRPYLGLPMEGTATLGIYSLFEGPSNWQVAKIVSSCVMSGYTNSTNTNSSEPAEDVSLVRLDKPVSYGPRVQPICLEDPNRSTPNIAWNVSVMAGMGIANDQGDPSSIYVKKLLLERCTNESESEFAQTRRPDQICLTPYVKSKLGQPCEGDQGNGIYFQYKKDYFVMIGIFAGQPPSNCTPGSGEPALFSFFENLKAPMDYLLSSCKGMSERRYAHRQRLSRSTLASNATTITIERLQLFEPPGG